MRTVKTVAASASYTGTSGPVVTVLDVVSWDATLDAGWSPYAQGHLTVTLPDAATLAGLDPRTGGRITLTVTASHEGSAFLDSTRTFDLGVRSRVVDRVQGTVALTLASDEALLQDAGLVASAPDTSALAHQSSVRGIVSSIVLPRISATLSAGTDDADFTTLTGVTNALKNPSAEGSAAPWTEAGNCTVDWQASGGYQSDGCVHVASIGSGLVQVLADTSDTYWPATVGDSWTFSLYANADSSGPRKLQPVIRWFDDSKAQVNGDAKGTAVAIPASGYARATVTDVCPPGATQFWAFANITGGTVPDQECWLDEGMLVKGDGLDTGGTALAYFDGDTTDTGLYNYTWSGAPHDSSSQRTPVFDRAPDTLTHQPGVSMWDFISPVLQQSGLRLFCDEQRVWRLVAAPYRLPGVVTIATGYNAYTGSETVDRDATEPDGTPVWYDAVVVKYTWNDENNVSQTAYDVAGDAAAMRVWLKEVQSPYPGPGAAKMWLARGQGRAETLALTARTDYSATPGMNATVTLADVFDAYVSSVAWSSDSDDMTVGTLQVVDAPAGSWALVPAATTWADLAGAWSAWTS